MNNSAKDSSSDFAKTTKSLLDKNIGDSLQAYYVGAVAGGLSFIVNTADGIRLLLGMHKYSATQPFLLALTGLLIAAAMVVRIRRIKQGATAP